MIDSIKKTLHERFTSPFTGSFIISWLVVNWKFVLVIFSSEEYAQKIEVFSQLYPVVWPDKISCFILWPLLGAVFYVCIYQFFLGWTQVIWIMGTNFNKKKQEKKLYTKKELDSQLTQLENIIESKERTVEASRRDAELQKTLADNITSEFNTEKDEWENKKKNFDKNHGNLQAQNAETEKERDEARQKRDDALEQYNSLEAQYKNLQAKNIASEVNSEKEKNIVIRERNAILKEKNNALEKLKSLKLELSDLKTKNGESIFEVIKASDGYYFSKEKLMQSIRNSKTLDSNEKMMLENIVANQNISLNPANPDRISKEAVYAGLMEMGIFPYDQPLKNISIYVNNIFKSGRLETAQKKLNKS